jgi:hypothetical protein
MNAQVSLGDSLDLGPSGGAGTATRSRRSGLVAMPEA